MIFININIKLYLHAHQTYQGIVKIYFIPDVSEIPETYNVSTKLTFDVMGLKITMCTFSKFCEPLTIVQLKFLFKISY